MRQRIYYIVKGQPTTIKKVSSITITIAIVLFVIGDLLYTPLKTLPLELQMFAIGELIPRIFLEFNTIIIVLFCLGMTLYIFRWRTGTINLTDKLIVIDGLIAASILIEKINEISFFDSDFIAGTKRVVQIKTTDNIFKVKFKTDDNSADFAQKLVLSAGQYEHIEINSSIVQKPH